MGLFALILWFNDRPVTGNVIKLESVKRPRKEPADYKEGDIVFASCHGFGVCEGVLAKIDEECNRKNLKALLQENSEFGALVNKFCSSSVPIPDTSGPTSSTEELTSKSQECAPSTCTQAKKRKALQTGQKTDKGKKTKPTDQSIQNEKNLQKAASELELTELSAFASVRTESSTLVGESLQLLNRTRQEDDIVNVPVPVPECSGCSQLQVRVQQLEQRLLNVEHNLNWLWNTYQGTMQNQNIEQTQQNSQPAQVHHAHGDVSQTSGTVADKNEISLESRTDVPTFNGFTKEQLRAKVCGIEDFSKASKLLFRTLYKESEYVGRSLGGNKANKNFEARPSLEHPERLGVLYEIIRSNFPIITPAMIKLRLRDLLKPSRAHHK